MIRTPLAWGLVLSLLAATVPAQEPTLEYRVKAAYILNFIRYVEWPPGTLGDGPITVCVAGRNPFGTALEETVRGEAIEGRAIAVRVILEPEPGCHVLFVPTGANAGAYLRSARMTPVLTIGEAADFLPMGGIIGLRVDGGSVRFDIDQGAADRAALRISSRLLRLARPGAGGGTQ
ncbi:MAG: YfiR family protein [Vicinamibacterales bacterium]